jgi:aminoglycoside 2'-N-acetyltransferase I
VIEVRVAHTAQLDDAGRRAVRTMLDAAFDGLSNQDWEHALGGMHAMVWDGAGLVAHGAVVQRRMLHGGRALRTGYVEAVGVHPNRRGEGHGGRVMAAIEQIIRGAYDLGALASSEMALGFYAARGWQRWRGSPGVLAPEAPERTPHEGIFVFPVDVPLDIEGEILCDWRDGAVW